MNSAALVHRGAVVARYDKHFLPNYGVFDEARYFVPGEAPLVFEMNGHRVCVAICEDLWRQGGPVQWAREFDADLLAVLNASPYERMKDDRRLELCVEQAQASGSAVAYTNMTGGQDELVFDGDSLVVDAAGQLLQRACQFDSQILFADLTATRVTPSSRDDVPVSIPVSIPPSSTSARERAPLTPANTARLDDSAELYAALRLGLADYVNKNGFTSVLLGLSGGIDSAFVGALAVDALGADRVFGVAMPSRYSSTHSVQDAHDLAERTGLTLREVPIGPMFDAFQSSLHLTGLAEENLQARIRGMVLMSLSNAEGHLVLATGNKSELSVGYSTIYGDAVGGFAPIKDVPKTLVWDLARWRNEQAGSAGSAGPIPPRSDHQGAIRGARPRPEGLRLTSRLPRPRQRSRGVRRRRHRRVGTRVRRLRRCAGRAHRAPDGWRRVQAAPIPLREPRSGFAPSDVTVDYPSPIGGANAPIRTPKPPTRAACLPRVRSWWGQVSGVDRSRR